MRKLSTLVLLAFLAVPALCFASNGPADAAPKTNVIWIAVGNTPMAVEAGPDMEMVTICYYGVTMTVREKIAKRYIRIGARCNSCEEGNGDGPQEGSLSSAIGEGGVCGEKFLTKGLAPVSAEKAIKIGK